MKLFWGKLYLSGGALSLSTEGPSLNPFHLLLEELCGWQMPQTETLVSSRQFEYWATFINVPIPSLL